MARNKEAAAEAAANGEETEEKAAPQTKKDPKPEGYVSPVLFAKLWSCRLAGVDPSVENYNELDEKQQVRPQIIYGYLRNNKAFAEAAVETNTDGRLMVNTNAGLDFLVAKAEEKAAKKAAKEAADVEAAAAEEAAE